MILFLVQIWWEKLKYDSKTDQILKKKIGTYKRLLHTKRRYSDNKQNHIDIKYTSEGKKDNQIHTLLKVSKQENQTNNIFTK